MARSSKTIIFSSHGVGQNIELQSLAIEGETVWSNSWKIGYDGAKGSNAACAMQRLGADVDLICKVGNDYWGEIGLKTLRDYGIGTKHVIIAPDFNTLIGIVMVDAAGKNSIILGGDTASFTAEEITRSIDACGEFGYFITGFEIEAASALCAARYARALGAYTILNPSPAPKAAEDLSCFNLCVLNESECRDLLRLRAEDFPLDAEAAAALLCRSYNIPAAVLTLGGEGCVLYDGARSERIPATDVKAVDTSGAGDSFLAALCCSLTRGHSLGDACRFAALYSGLAVQKQGTFPSFATLSELKDRYPDETRGF